MTSRVEQYRQLASESRRVAKTFSLDEDRKALLEVADQWDRLADQQERAANLRSWRVIIIRSKGEYLGSVEAPDPRVGTPTPPSRSFGPSGVSGSNEGGLQKPRLPRAGLCSHAAGSLSICSTQKEAPATSGPGAHAAGHDEVTFYGFPRLTESHESVVQHTVGKVRA